jgi:hypothetical protein
MKLRSSIGCLAQHTHLLHNAAKGDSQLPAQNAALCPLKRRVVSPKGERAQVRLTIDSRFTQYYFDRFISVFKIRKRNAIAEHIIMNFKTKAAQARLQAFYKNEWQNIPYPEIDTAFVFPLTNKIRDELDRVGGEVLGGVNHSKAFRVIVAYLAFIHNFKEPKRIVR